MKKLFIILIILCLTAFAALEIYVQSDAFAERIRPYIVGPLQDVLGPDARIGFVKANFFPPYIEVRDVVLPDARGQEAISIRKVTVYINPLPLVFKKIRLPSITVLEPRMYAERAPDGALNVQPLVDRIKTYIERSKRGGPSGYTLFLHTITVWKGELRFKDDALSSQASITDLNMTARLDLASDRAAVTVRGSRVRVTAPAYPVVDGAIKASAEYNRGVIRLNTVELTAGDTAMRIRGEVGPLPDAVLNLEARVRSGPHTLGKLADILKPGRKQQGSRVEASVAIRGKASDPLVEGSFGFSGPTYGGMTLQTATLLFRYRDHSLAVSGDNWRIAKQNKTLVIDRIASTLAYRRGILDIQSFELTAGDLSARVQGAVDPSKGFDARMTLLSSGAGRTISFLTSFPIEGMISLEGHLTGALNAPVFSGAIAARPVTVRGVQFDDLNGKLGYDNKQIQLSSVDVRQQSSRYVLDGTADFSAGEPVFTARLRVLKSVVSNIIALFYKPLPLRLSATGELSFQGTARQYTGGGYLSLDEGVAYGESFTRGAVTASLTTGRVSFPQVVLYKKKGMVKAAGWIAFDGTYSADIESRDIDLAAVDHLAGTPVDGTAVLDIHSSGSFSKPVVKASLGVEELSIRGIAVGSMHGAAELRDGQLKITAGLSDDSGRLSVRWLVRKPYTWTAEAKIRTDGINPLLFFGNKDVSDRVKVIADGTVTAHGAGLNHASVSGEAVFERIGLVMGDYRIDNESPAVFSIDNGKLAIKALNFRGPGTRIGVTGTAKAFADVDIAVTGTADLSLLKLLFPETEFAAGTAQMKLTIKDDWSNPDVAGELHIQNGEIKIQDIPQKFTALNGKVLFTQGRIVTDSLAGEMGGGTLAVSGWAQLTGVTLREFSVKTAVDNVTVRYPEGLTSTLSGSLYYDGNAKEQTLSGDVMIKRARYDKRIEWKSMLVDLGRGLYQKKKTEIGWIGDTQVNVRFHGSDNILFQNNLAQMPLDIDVFLRGTVNHPQLLGRIEARKGSVFFRKNDFNILHASVDFIDPNRMNPVLDIQAETQVREYQIRLAVTGTAEHAAVTFISDPPLIDTDILSLLALGKKGSELAGKETNVGVGEAASFASGQFQDFVERRTRSLTGLDRFQIDPYVGKSDTSVPRVTVGKELIQNKLYVTYSSNVGASIPEQIWRIEYLLNKHFSLVGERNEIGNTGGDIKFRFEFK